MKKKDTLNYYESTFEAKLSEFYQAKSSLESSVREVAARKMVIDFYPEGADRKKAQQELADSQRSLICRIGAYDARLAAVTIYYTNNYEQLSHYASPDRFGTSHDIVVNVAKNYLQYSK